jgi:peptidoglycan/xylan/chitin deacetylase (PgdA/CDA1 family)
MTADFESQLEYITANYSVCSLSQVLEAARGTCELPRNACVLTFDDGLIDHYRDVFPRLRKRGLKAAFFPSARPVVECRVLDVHKIHFILAAVADVAQLSREIFQLLNNYRNSVEIPTEQDLRGNLEVPGRYDSAEIILVKRMLQWALPKEVRSEIIHQLFSSYVTEDEASFACDLYMNISQLQEMASSGMEIGGHGYDHAWLGELTVESQMSEIQKTVAFLNYVFGRYPKDWFLCYPFGSYNSSTIRLASAMGCALGLTTNPTLANIIRPMELSRLDTNDLPVSVQ